MTTPIPGGQSPESEQIPTLRGHRPGAEQEKMIEAAAEAWRKLGYEAPVQALARIEEAAKQLVALTGTLQGLYLAIFAFSEVRQQVPPGLLLPFLLPLALWLASLFCATRVFVPQVRPGADLDDFSVTAWQKLRDTYLETAAQKLAWLHWSQGLLVGSFGVVLLLLVVLVFLPDAPAAGPAEMIILTPTPVPLPTLTP